MRKLGRRSSAGDDRRPLRLRLLDDAATGRPLPSDLRIELALNHGVPGEHGNLLGIEPVLYPGDYQNLQRLHRKLSAYLEQARAQGLVSPRTVVVLPEHIGTWLWARGEKNELYQSPSATKPGSGWR